MHAGQTFETDDVQFEFLATAAETAGALHEMRATYRAGSPDAPSHLHPAQEERFVIEAGTMVFRIAGVDRTVTAGEEIVIPPGTAHRARNASDREPAVALWQTRPALRTAEFFVAFCGIDGSILDQALLAWTYRDVFALATTPRLLGSVAVGAVGRIARLAGRSLPT